jgi:hypothetical protein
LSREPFRHNALPATWDVIRSAATPKDCFADEIAIDFPSLDQVVERIREGLQEEPPSANVLSTELRLSTRDAQRGLVVPLDVPMRRLCRLCDGRGETWTGPCDRCCGTGESLFRHPVRVSLPAGVSNGARFRFRVTSPDALAVRVELRVAIRSSAA